MHRGKPPPEPIRHEVPYEDLLGGARRRVPGAYRGLW
jgi:hypothetical protein